MKRRLEITLETEELFAVEDLRAGIRFCRECGAPEVFLTTSEAARLSGLSERSIFRSIERGEVHFCEAERVYVCQISIGALAERLSAED